MQRAGLWPSCRLFHQNRSVPLIICQSKGFGKPKKVATRRPEKEQQQSQLLQPSQPRPESTVSTPTFLTEDTADTTEEVPEEISNRILRRILIFAGLPTFSGILSLPLFYYLKVIQHLEIPTWGVYIASFLTFGVGVLGISYGALSASWTAKEGSLLGVEEFKANLPFALEKLRGR